MRKKSTEDYLTKAKKREIKKRQRMHMHAASLKKSYAHAGKKLITK